jgi:hypothetical protein
MSGVQGWGPQHQPGRRGAGEPGWKWVLRVIIALAILGLANGAARTERTITVAGGSFWLAVLIVAALPGGIQRRLLAPLRRGGWRRLRAPWRAPELAPVDPHTSVRRAALAAGGACISALTAAAVRVMPGLSVRSFSSVRRGRARRAG